jgi:hypothetical protein
LEIWRHHPPRDPAQGNRATSPALSRFRTRYVDGLTPRDLGHPHVPRCRSLQVPKLSGRKNKPSFAVIQAFSRRESKRQPRSAWCDWEFFFRGRVAFWLCAGVIKTYAVHVFRLHLIRRRESPSATEEKLLQTRLAARLSRAHHGLAGVPGTVRSLGRHSRQHRDTPAAFCNRLVDGVRGSLESEKRAPPPDGPRFFTREPSKRGRPAFGSLAAYFLLTCVRTVLAV